MPWYKGNIHCHSNRGLPPALPLSATPVDVAKFYQFNGFDFLGISDHNVLTPVEAYINDTELLGIPCCEYTHYSNNCHVVGINLKHSVYPSNESYKAAKIEGFSVDESDKIMTLQEGVDLVNKDGGIPVLCHPFWRWAYDWKIASAVKDWNFLEFNIGPNCNSIPNPAGSPGDEMWDKLLSIGMKVYVIAVDDAHEYFSPYNPHTPCGYRGYIVVRADKLERNAILDAILNGEFYSSSGLEIDEYMWDKKNIYIKIKQHQTERILFQFFGLNGKELSRTNGLETTYDIHGDEGYVRCRIASTTGTYAWTQPVFLQ